MPVGVHFGNEAEIQKVQWHCCHHCDNLPTNRNDLPFDIIKSPVLHSPMYCVKSLLTF